MTVGIPIEAVANNIDDTVGTNSRGRHRHDSDTGIGTDDIARCRGTL